jgi:hypothetical protein
VVIVNYKDKTKEVFIKPPDFEQGGLSGAGFDLAKGREVDFILVYPMAFEGELGLLEEIDYKGPSIDVLGDNHYSLGHLILIPNPNPNPNPNP